MSTRAALAADARDAAFRLSRRAVVVRSWREAEAATLREPVHEGVTVEGP